MPCSPQIVREDMDDGYSRDMTASFGKKPHHMGAKINYPETQLKVDDDAFFEDEQNQDQS